MKSLSIAAAWDETAAFVRRHFGLLFLIAFGLVALPGVILQAAAPSVEPGKMPEGGPWMLLLIPLIVCGILGTLTISRLAILGSGDAGEAFRHALRRLPAMLGAVLLFGLAIAIVAIPLTLITALLGLSQQAAATLALLLLLLAFIFVWVRLILINPVGAMEPAGPVAILKRSWRLTAGHFWRIFAFILVLVLAFMVVSVAVSAVAGTLIILVAGQPQDGSLSHVLLLLIGGILNAVLSVFLAVMIARIYVRLAEGTSGT